LASFLIPFLITQSFLALMTGNKARCNLQGKRWVFGRGLKEGKWF
jgi:hypothetical protein